MVHTRTTKYSSPPVKSARAKPAIPVVPEPPAETLAEPPAETLAEPPVETLAEPPVDFPETLVDFPETLVDFPETLADFPETPVEEPDDDYTYFDFPEDSSVITIDSVCCSVCMANKLPFDEYTTHKTYEKDDYDNFKCPFVVF